MDSHDKIIVEELTEALSFDFLHILLPPRLRSLGSKDPQLPVDFKCIRICLSTGCLGRARIIYVMKLGRNICQPDQVCLDLNSPIYYQWLRLQVFKAPGDRWPINDHAQQSVHEAHEPPELHFLGIHVAIRSIGHTVRLHGVECS